ncbi:DoxX family protein [Streptomyces racemochromogenes]|uniref:DoxX family protein n=1 Tax=Streptomyces racemochromogenes TaxID=67353 RepID=A0ABW7P5X8_9ACTN
MSTTATVVTLVAALMAGFSGVSVLRGAKFVTEPLVEYGVPKGMWAFLGTVKIAGALGLLAGFAVPALGVAAAVGLVLYFTGAVITVLRARSYAHVAFPLIYAAPAAAVLALV